MQDIFPIQWKRYGSLTTQINPKPEGRKSCSDVGASITALGLLIRMWTLCVFFGFRISAFGFLSDFGFRISNQGAL